MIAQRIPYLGHPGTYFASANCIFCAICHFPNFYAHQLAGKNLTFNQSPLSCFWRGELSSNITRKDVNKEAGKALTRFDY